MKLNTVNVRQDKTIIGYLLIHLTSRVVINCSYRDKISTTFLASMSKLLPIPSSVDTNIYCDNIIVTVSTFMVEPLLIPCCKYHKNAKYNCDLSSKTNIEIVNSFLILSKLKVYFYSL